MLNSLLTSREVSEILGVSTGTLCLWRRSGGGPREVRDALIYLSERTPRYRRRLIERFVEGGFR